MNFLELNWEVAQQVSAILSHMIDLLISMTLVRVLRLSQL
jgi:hypothetical protein